MPEAEMGFWDHVDVLRGALMRYVAVLAVAVVGLFVAMPTLFDAVVLAPCRGDFPLYAWLAALSGDASVSRFGVELVNINLASQFMIHLSSSFWGAVVLTAPYAVWEVWRFVAPALYSGERRGAAVASVMGCAMFYAGMAVAYLLVFPLSLRFLATYTLSDAIPNVISIDSYMDMFMGLCLVTGLMFELPPLAWLLGRMGLLGRGLFNRYRRHAVVALLVLAAFITPTGDPLTLAVVFVPLYMLWELSAWLVPAQREGSEQQS